MNALKAWFEERLKTLLAKSPTAEAIRYALRTDPLPRRRPDRTRYQRRGARHAPHRFESQQRPFCRLR